MTDRPSFTVAILSHRRRNLLGRVIEAVTQLDYPMFEIAVVGDQPDLDDYRLKPKIARQIRYRHLAEANISKGRNIALQMAAGDIVAFCDDDAVPEPSWLRMLAGAFRRDDVAAASGTVLASDGLTAEWRARFFSPAGRDAHADLPPDGLIFADPPAQTSTNCYLGLIGANSAFRRNAALRAGGFDEAYVYFLEETDMAIRLAHDGWSAAFVPGATVHHLREQNASRSSANVPRDLFQIAASKAYFCRRHLPTEQISGELGRFRDERLRRLDPHIRLGALRANGLKRLKRQLDRGLQAGAGRTPVLPLSPGPAPSALAQFKRPGPSPTLRIAVVGGWGTHIARTRHLARRLAGAGHLVSCFSYVSGMHPVRVTFTDGLWLHRGGTWRLNQFSDSGDPVIRRRTRALAEVDRVAPHRQFDAIVRLGRVRPDAETTVIELDTPPSLGPMTAWSSDRRLPVPPDVRDALEAALNDTVPDTKTAGAVRVPRMTKGRGRRLAVSRYASKRYPLSDAPLGHG